MRLQVPAAIFTLLTLAGSVASPRAQSLADVAKQEEERRKTIKPVSKVLTNKDLGDVPAAPIIPVADTKAVDAAKIDKPAEPIADASTAPVKDQAYWSGRMKELRTQLDRDQIFVEAIQTRVNSLSADFVNRDDPAQRALIERDRQRAIVELDRLKKAIEEGKKAIATLEEEARRAGVPPGWLR